MVGYPKQMASSPWLTQTAYSRSNARSQAVLACTLPPAPACPHEPDKIFLAGCCYLPYPPTKRQSDSRHYLSKLSTRVRSGTVVSYAITENEKEANGNYNAKRYTVTKTNKHPGNNCRLKLIRGGLRNRLLESSQSAKEIDPRLKWSQWRRAAPLTAHSLLSSAVCSLSTFSEKKTPWGLRVLWSKTKHSKKEWLKTAHIWWGL